MDPIALAHKLFDSIENRDSETFNAICHPDAVLWQAQRPETPRPFIEFFRGLSNLHGVVKNLRYVERRYENIEGGNVLLFHALTGTTTLGKDVKAYMMIRLVLRDGKVARNEMVVDTAKLQPVYEATQAAAVSSGSSPK